jgi:hypothetical protein
MNTMTIEATAEIMNVALRPIASAR